MIQLVIGDFGLSLDEQQAQIALWAIFAAVGQPCPTQLMPVCSMCVFPTAAIVHV